MFTELLSKGVVNALAEVIRSIIHLYEDCSVDLANILSSYAVNESS